MSFRLVLYYLFNFFLVVLVFLRLVFLYLLVNASDKFFELFITLFHLNELELICWLLLIRNLIIIFGDFLFFLGHFIEINVLNFAFCFDIYNEGCTLSNLAFNFDWASHLLNDLLAYW